LEVQIYVCEYLDGIHDIQNALYSIDPIQTREWARKITKGPLNSFVNQILRSLKVAWQQTEQSQATTQNPFSHKRFTNRNPSHREAIIRVPHQAPPGLF